VLAAYRGPLVDNNLMELQGVVTRRYEPLKNVFLPSVLVYNFLSRTARQTDVIA
jgi:hypothetical protein